MNPAKLARYEKGLGIEAAAAAAGLNARTVRRIEKGEVEPSAETARALADAYGITVAQLLGLTERAA